MKGLVIFPRAGLTCAEVRRLLEENDNLNDDYTKVCQEVLYEGREAREQRERAEAAERERDEALASRERLRHSVEMGQTWLSALNDRDALEKERDELRAMIKDPAAIWVNHLRGTIQLPIERMENEAILELRARLAAAEEVISVAVHLRSAWEIGHAVTNTQERLLAALAEYEKGGE